MGSYRDRLDALINLEFDNPTDMLFQFDDRESLIMMAGYLEDILSFGITCKMYKYPTEAEYEQVFSGYGPISSFSAKIIIGYLTGVITENSKHDLLIIKTMRNDAAHTYKKFSLSSGKNANRCLSLKSQTEIKDQEQFKKLSREKQCLMRSAGGIVWDILMAIAVRHQEKRVFLDNTDRIIGAAYEAIKSGDIFLSDPELDPSP